MPSGPNTRSARKVPSGFLASFSTISPSSRKLVLL